MDGEWEFTTDPGRALDNTLSGVALRAIQVPMPWQAQFPDLRDYTGVAWYRRTFRWTRPRPSARSQCHAPDLLRRGGLLHAGVAQRDLVGEHEGGYLPFEFAGGFGAFGWTSENEVVVRVIDPGSDADADLGFPFAEIPHGKQSWYGPDRWNLAECVPGASRGGPPSRACGSRPTCRASVRRSALELSRPAARPLQPRDGLSRRPVAPAALRPSDRAGRATSRTDDAGSAARAVGHRYAQSLSARRLSLGERDRSSRSTSRGDHFGMRSIGASPDGFCC